MDCGETPFNLQNKIGGIIPQQGGLVKMGSMQICEVEGQNMLKGDDTSIGIRLRDIFLA
jgi:hypothetical protein